MLEGGKGCRIMTQCCSWIAPFGKFLLEFNSREKFSFLKRVEIFFFKSENNLWHVSLFALVTNQLKSKCNNQLQSELYNEYPVDLVSDTLLYMISELLFLSAC